MMKHLLRVVIFIILSLPSPGLYAAISMEYSLGFNNHFQLKTWTPLTVVLENRGRATSGTLEVLVTSGSEYLGNVHTTTYTMDVELPYNSTKLCSFTILITTFTHDLIIRLQQAEKIMLSRSINLRPYYTSKSLAVILADKASPDVLAMLPQSLFPVSGRHAKFLPETWYGYDGIKILITDAEMFKSLRERQFQALAQWIKRGGYLVTAGGVNYGSLLEPRTQHLLPIRIAGHQQFLELTSLKDFCGQPLTSSDPFLVLHANIEDSNVLIQEQGIPLIIEKNVEAGKILFLAFDFQNPPFSQWAHRQIFWENILSRQPKTEAKGIDPADRKILDVMLANLPVGFPDIRYILLVVGVYVVLLRLFLSSLGKLQEKKWKTCGYLLIVLSIFFITSSWFSFSQSTKKKLTYNSFLFMNLTGQHKIASAKYLIGLYSVRDTEYNFHFGEDLHPVTYFLPEHLSPKIPGRHVLHEDISGQHVTGFIGKWSSDFFMFHTKFEFPVAGQARLDAQHLRILIENMTPHKLTNCQVYFDNRVFFVGDILPHKKHTEELMRPETDNNAPFDRQNIGQFVENIATDKSSSFVKAMQKNLAEEVLLEIYSQSRRDRIYLIGWIESGIIKANFTDQEIAGENLTLMTWEIPVNDT